MSATPYLPPRHGFRLLHCSDQRAVLQREVFRGFARIVDWETSLAPTTHTARFYATLVSHLEEPINARVCSSLDEAALFLVGTRGIDAASSPETAA